MAALSSICLVLLALGLVSGDSATTDQKKAELSGFALANNYFGFNLLSLLSEENGRKPQLENLFFSPYSVSSALGMLYQGAGGATSNQFETALGYQFARLDTDKAAVARQIRDSDSAILLTGATAPAPNASYVLRTGNALLQNKQFAVLDSYRQSLVDNFRAELFAVNFATEGEAVKNLVNQWVGNRTNGKIPKLLAEPPAQDTLLALINAVYFKGTWKSPFNVERTEPGTFYGPNGVNFSKVKFMNANDRYRFAQINEWNATLLELPYQGDDLSFFAILPLTPTGDLKQVKKELTPFAVESAIGQLGSERKVRIQLPKLDFKTTYDLVDTLKAAGITDVFDAAKADLSAISAQQRLRVDVVKHMASIEVNEEGAEAAGATFVGITKTSLVRPVELLFNRPFVFFIRHNQNGQVLFLGEVNKF